MPGADDVSENDRGEKTKLGRALGKSGVVKGVLPGEGVNKRAGVQDYASQKHLYRGIGKVGILFKS